MGTPLISSILLEAPDVAVAESFYAALGITDRVRVRAGDSPTSGFRGYTLSLVTSQPGNADTYMRAALEAGATELKPAKKSFWGYGGVVQAPDGAVWKFASSSKKDTGPAAQEHDHLVLLLGVEDVQATRQFYLDHGLAVAKSYGSKYVELEVAAQGIQLSLYTRRAAAKDAGVAAKGTGSHRLAIRGDIGELVDPDGFVWEPSTADRLG